MTPQELRLLRLSLDWSQIDTAKRLGLSDRQYRYLEQGLNSRGKPTPTVPPAVGLAMLALSLAAAPAASALVETERLANFRHAVDHEAGIFLETQNRRPDPADGSDYTEEEPWLPR